MANPFPALAAVALMALLPLAGCTDSNALVDPAADVEETGRVIHLKATVIDWANHTIYPGLKTYMWAFCFEPFDASDTVSAAAIEGWSRLPSDALNNGEADKRNCGVPGPTIRVQQGDRVIVEFSHAHVHPHTIHWHGQYVPGENCPDGACPDGAPGVTQEAVPTGGSYVYNFIAKKAGTLWYHCHVDTQLHVMEGLYGMFIVEPKDRSHEPKADREYKMVLSSATRAIIEAIPGVAQHSHPPGCFISGTPDCQNQPLDTTPDVFMINGRSYPLTMDDPDTLIKVKEGGATRVRILNAGTTFETLHPHGQDMLVTHRDGNPLSSPFWVDTLTIGPAERYDVVIYGTNPGVWMIHTHVNTHETNDGQAPGGMHTMLVYDGFEDQMHQFRQELPGGLPYMAPQFLPPDRDLSMTLALGVATPPPAPGIPSGTPVSGVDANWAFPVERDCATRSVMLEATASGGAAQVMASQVILTLTKADGTPVLSAPLGRDASNQVHTYARYEARQAEPALRQFDLPQGNYTVHLGGTSAGMTVALHAHVDYYDSVDEMKLAHRLDKTRPYCGKYGNVNDGAGLNVPPV